MRPASPDARHGSCWVSRPWRRAASAPCRPDPFIISEAAKGTYLKERDRRVLEDNRRQIEEAERSQREFEQRKAAETEAGQGARPAGLSRARVERNSLG